MEAQEKLDVKETKELTEGLLELVPLMAEVMKDGLQATDAIVVWQKLQAHPELSAKILAAYNGVEKVPAELKDLDLTEGIELAMIGAKAVPKILEALKK